MMKSVEIVCHDRYEAQKMASLIFVKKDDDDGGSGVRHGSSNNADHIDAGSRGDNDKDTGETYITSILNVIGNEVVISLKDGSAHSIVLRDEKNVDAFADFIQSVIDGEDRLVSARILPCHSGGTADNHDRGGNDGGSDYAVAVEIVKE